MRAPRVAVIGAGVTGLALAHRLLELSAEKGMPLDVRLYESGPRAGGAIETVREEGFLMEKGPDSFISEKPAILALSKRLGIHSQIIETKNQYRRSFILKGHRLVPLPEGFYIISPTKVFPFLKSPLLSWRGKFRMLWEPFVAKRQSITDESIGSFIRRRFGDEAFDRIGQPMFSGIYTGDPDTLSLQATMRRFSDLERDHRSVILGLLKDNQLKDKKIKESSGPRYGLFLSFQRGMETLVSALTDKIPEDVLCLKTPLREVNWDAKRKKWRLELGRDKEDSVDALCLTTPAKHAAQALRGTDLVLSQILDGIRYESVATLNLAYRQEDIRHPLDGFGFVVPKIEYRTMIGCSFSSTKFDYRALQGYALLRVFIGGAFGRDAFQLRDKNLLAAVQRDLSGLLGIKGKPVMTCLQRYENGMVQYGVGHRDLLVDIENRLRRFQGLYLSGSAYHGVGISHCVAHAEETADEIFESIYSTQGGM